MTNTPEQERTARLEAAKKMFATMHEATMARLQTMNGVAINNTKEN